MPTALITGVTGQDGSYLAQLLLQKGYRVVGLLRRSSSSDVLGERLRWPGVEGDVELRGGDLIDISSLGRVISDAAPDEVYNRRRVLWRPPGINRSSQERLPRWAR
jgi:GDPmannose 4,6-dehydratase